MGLLSFRGCHPQVAEAGVYCVQLAGENGFEVIVTSTARSYQEQQQLYQHWLMCKASGNAYTSVCPYPANPPGDSAHGMWRLVDGSIGALAFDSVPALEGGELPRDDYRWDWWRQIREWVGFRVPDNDAVHAEVPDWRSYVVGLATK